MSDPDPVQQSVAALARFFVGDGTMHDTVQRVVDLAASAITPADMIGLTMMVEDKPATAFFNGPEAVHIDQAQYDSGTGPCLDAFRDRAVYTITSMTDEDRWPAFTKSALEHGVHSSMSLPLRTGDRAVGALNFYARETAAFGSDEEARGQLFADQAGVVLLNAQSYWDAQLLSERMSEAMRSRAVIEQAKGILIAQSRIDADAAFAILVEASQGENRKVRDIAEEIVEKQIRRP